MADGLALYQVARAAVYHAGDPARTVLRRLTLARLPTTGTPLVLAGVAAVDDALAHLSLGAPALRWLQRQPPLRGVAPAFFSDLAALRFRGRWEAPPAGSTVAVDAPLFSMALPAWIAPLVEDRVRGALALESSAATLAAAAAAAVPGATVIETGPAGWLGTDTVVRLARGAAVGGARGTVHLPASMQLGLPLWTPRDAEGLLLHRELVADDRLLVNVPVGANPDAFVARLRPLGPRLAVLRLDRLVRPDHLAGLRRALDRADLRFVRLLLDADLPPRQLAPLAAAGAPIDLVGLRLGALLQTVAPDSLAWSTAAPGAEE